jgi:hypothetical protein
MTASLMESSVIVARSFSMNRFCSTALRWMTLRSDWETS